MMPISTAANRTKTITPDPEKRLAKGAPDEQSVSPAVFNVGYKLDRTENITTKRTTITIMPTKIPCIAPVI